MTILTREQIAEIQARADVATEGPWSVIPNENEVCVFIDRHGDETICSYDYNKRDGDFIAAARADIPALIASHEALRAELASEERRTLKLRRRNEREGRQWGAIARELRARVAELEEDLKEADDAATEWCKLCGQQEDKNDRYAGRIEELEGAIREWLAADDATGEGLCSERGVTIADGHRLAVACNALRALVPK